MMLFPYVISALGFAAALGPAVAATLPVEARQAEPPEEADAFLITRAYLTKPAGRPGSYKYCSIIREFSHLRWKPPWVYKRGHPGRGGVDRKKKDRLTLMTGNTQST